LKLTTAPQVLIGSFIALGGIFFFREMLIVTRGGDRVTHVLLAVAGLVTAVVSGLYLRHFRKRLLERGGLRSKVAAPDAGRGLA